MDLITEVLGLDSMLTVILLVFMITTWILRQEASKREHELSVLRDKLQHERLLSRDAHFTNMTMSMIELLKACQEEIAERAEGGN